MKKCFSVMLMMLISISLTACKEELKTPEEKLGYALGSEMGKTYKTFKENEVAFDEKSFFQGFTDGLNDGELLLTADEVKAVQLEAITKLKNNLELKKAAEAEKNLKEGAQFLVENSEKEGVVVTKSGLQYQILTKGEGSVPVATNTVKVNYVGTLLDGTEFDSSYTRGEPAEFRVGAVIKGWSEALQMMPTGSKWKLFIPSELAYGARGAGKLIGPNATLVFEVELLEIVK